MADFPNMFFSLTMLEYPHMLYYPICLIILECCITSKVEIS